MKSPWTSLSVHLGVASAPGSGSRTAAETQICTCKASVAKSPMRFLIDGSLKQSRLYLANTIEESVSRELSRSLPGIVS